MQKFVFGIDYGTDSVRAVLVNTHNGEELATSVFHYPRWKKGLYCNAAAHRFRQHPLDYVEGLEHTIKDCLQKAGEAVAQQVVGISIDTTGSTPVAVNKAGTPLALLPEFENEPDAMFVLWKDHTATKEAAEINQHTQKFDTDYLQFVGGIYSSEWYWAKLLHLLRTNENLRSHVYSFVEHCDWIPFLLTGGSDFTQLKRGICSAGHKALWAEEFGGLPPEDFFTSLDPLLAGHAQKNFEHTYTAAEAAGTISEEWATRLGIPNTVVIGIGAFDCHMGAVGGQIEPYYLSKVMGTSTCDMLVAPVDAMQDTLVKGICGQVNGSIIPGMIGLEAGQSAFGDVYAWFKNILTWPLSLIEDETIQQQVSDTIIAKLSAAAEQLPLQENDELAVDWLNGRRTPDANQLLKGSIQGINLATDAPRIFKALVEATCFGAKAIADRFIEQGVPVKGLIGMGGVAQKAPYIMQTMTNIMGMPLRIHKSEQTCAAGAAMFAATVAGVYTKVEDAMTQMGQGFDKTYYPDESTAAVYAKRYEQYKQSGNFIEHGKI